jgi:hypothetical protein
MVSCANARRAIVSPSSQPTALCCAPRPRRLILREHRQRMLREQAKERGARPTRSIGHGYVEITKRVTAHGRPYTRSPTWYVGPTWTM